MNTKKEIIYFVSQIWTVPQRKQTDEAVSLFRNIPENKEWMSKL